MKVGDFVRELGIKAGLLHLEEKERAEEVAEISTRVLSLKALMEEEGEPLTRPPAELSIKFEQLFAALPACAHGWTVEKVRELLASETLKNLPRTDLEKAVKEELSKAQVPVEDIVKDALNRDRALDSYQESLEKKFKDREQSVHDRIRELQQEIEDCQKQISELKSSEESSRRLLQEWVDQKSRIEEDMVSVVSLLSDAHGITVTKK